MERIQMVFGVPKTIELKVERSSQFFFIYGLSKETQLNKHFFKYPSTLNSEKSFIDLLIHFKEQNENIALYATYYLILYAHTNKDVVQYLLKFPPVNYIGANLLDWLRFYVEQQLKILPNSFNPPK